MKKRLSSLAGLLLASGMIVPSLRAETQVGITNIDVTATVPGVNSLTALIRNIDADADPNNDVAAPGVAFGSVASNVGPWSTLPQQYLHIKVEDNAVAWRLATYTNNFTVQPSTSVWGFQYGGLRGAADGAKVPMGWLNNPTSLANGPGTGNPAQALTNGWTFIKDLKDADDPATVNDPNIDACNNVETFACAGGYPNIAFGSAASTNIVRPNVGGSELLPAPDATWYFYMEGHFNGAPATSYNTNVVLELLNQ